jgi:hypothetical protein
MTKTDDDPRPTRGRRLIGAALIASLAAAAVWPAPAGARPTKPGPPGLTIGQYDHKTAPPLSPADQRRDDIKQAAAAAHMRAKLRAQTAVRTNRAATDAATQDLATTTRSLGVSYQIQQEPSWCGPTTLAIILGYKGWGWSGSSYTQQSAAASLLGVSANGGGTPWIGGDNVPTGGPWVSSYPMQDALNYQDYRHTGNTFWAPNAVPGSPSSADINEYEGDLVADIDVSYPFANNEYAAPNNQLQKQPSNTMIMHWFASSGYASSGATTYFSDPGWGGGTRSYDSTHDVVVAIGGRGFVW